jgi:hypothetical protein
MTTVMPEGAALRKALQWISKMREAGAKDSLAILVEQASVRFNLSPKDSEFLTRFFNEQQAAEGKKK